MRTGAAEREFRAARPKLDSYLEDAVRSRERVRRAFQRSEVPAGAPLGRVRQTTSTLYEGGALELDVSERSQSLTTRYVVTDSDAHPYNALAGRAESFIDGVLDLEDRRLVESLLTVSTQSSWVTDWTSTLAKLIEGEGVRGDLEFAERHTLVALHRVGQENVKALEKMNVGVVDVSTRPITELDPERAGFVLPSALDHAVLWIEEEWTLHAKPEGDEARLELSSKWLPSLKAERIVEIRRPRGDEHEPEEPDATE